MTRQELQDKIEKLFRRLRWLTRDKQAAEREQVVKEINLYQKRLDILFSKNLEEEEWENI